MPLSVLTGFTPIASGSNATPGLWNSRFQLFQENLSGLNDAAGVSAISLSVSANSLAGWNKGSITTTLDTSGGTLSVLTIGAASGNTVSVSTWAVSASSVSALGFSGVAGSFGTLQTLSGNTMHVVSHLSMGNKRIESLQTPVNSMDAANKSYVDGAAAGKVTLYSNTSHYNLVATSASSTTLSVVTIAAGKLATNGDMVLVRIWGDEVITGSGVANMCLVFGGTRICAFSGADASVTNWRAEGIVARTGTVNQRANILATRSTSNVNHSNTSAGETLSGAIPVWFEAADSSGLNNATINVFGLTVEAINV